MRVGAGGYATENDSFFSLPVMANKLYGRGPHYFELGFGLTLFAFDEDNYSTCSNGYYDSNGNYICTSYQDDSYYEFILPVDGSPSLMGTMNFGYRRVPVDGGFTWRINLTPIFNNNGFWPLYAGVGFGYAFWIWSLSKILCPSGQNLYASLQVFFRNRFKSSEMNFFEN